MLVFLDELVVAFGNFFGEMTVPTWNGLIQLIPGLTKDDAMVRIGPWSSLSFRTGYQGCQRTLYKVLLLCIVFASGLWRARLHIFLLAPEQPDSVDFAPRLDSRRVSLL